MSLNEKILILYPELKDIVYNPFKNPPYILQDDGEGPYIKIWNYNKPCPTQDDLNNIND
jgi:hypothetical protein